MSYEQLSKKTKRILENQLAILFSSKALLKITSISELLKLKPFPPEIKYQGNSLFLSSHGIDDLTKIGGLIKRETSVCNDILPDEINGFILENLEFWLNKNLRPNGEEFMVEFIRLAYKKVQNFKFLVPITGMDLKDLNELSIGAISIQRPDIEFFQKFQFGELLNEKLIYEQLSDSLWLTGCANGSPYKARESFQHKTILAVGILGIYGSILYKGQIWQTRVNATISSFDNRKTATSISWVGTGENLSYSRSWGPEQDLPFTAESLAYLKETCFLEQMGALIDNPRPSELDISILKSIYWFSEVYKDRNPIMQFTKLWVCAESFFSGDKEKIVSSNVKGITAILLFAGFNVITPEQSKTTKKRIEDLYDLRSRALHQATFHEISNKDLCELSHWIAWVIISMVALSQKGYKTNRQVMEQVERLNHL
jgi:hypothetical protein